MLSTICLGLKLVTRLPLILRGVSCPENQGATPMLAIANNYENC
jgi:hypothetical protein